MNALTILGLLVFGFMTAFFCVSVWLQRNDIVDVAWGLGFVLVAWASYFLGAGHLKSLLSSIPVTLWGLRLAYHTGIRMIGRPEDSRYAAWRTAWTTYFYLRSFVIVYMLQGFLLMIIALPVIAAHLTSYQCGYLWPIGLAIWVIGFACEVVADWQLKHFISQQQNHGKVCDVGLWRYSRHPNYFGEVTLWWGMYLLCLPHDYYVITLVGPLAITFLILYVSGVPMLEKEFENNQDYQLYKKRTSAFIPWFSKKTGAV